MGVGVAVAVEQGLRVTGYLSFGVVVVQGKLAQMVPYSLISVPQHTYLIHI